MVMGSTGVAGGGGGRRNKWRLRRRHEPLLSYIASVPPQV
jgi:hypothetical protein